MKFLKLILLFFLAIFLIKIMFRLLFGMISFLFTAAIFIGFLYIGWRILKS